MKRNQYNTVQSNSWIKHNSGITSPAEAKIIVGGPHTCHGWGDNVGSITLTCASTPVSPMAAVGTVSSRLVLGRVIRRTDTGRHKQQPLITVGDVRIVEHFVK